MRPSPRQGQALWVSCEKIFLFSFATERIFSPKTLPELIRASCVKSSGKRKKIALFVPFRRDLGFLRLLSILVASRH